MKYVVLFLSLSLVLYFSFIAELSMVLDLSIDYNNDVMPSMIA